MSSNEQYARAQQHMASGEYATALQEFNTALVLARGARQAAQIRFNIAHATSLTGDPIKAIELYKQIVEDEDNSPILRAYAIQYMGRQYYGSRSEAISDAIFTGDTFAPMRVAGNDIASYRNLFEYGSDIYPLALAELYIASGYVSELSLIPTEASEVARDHILKVIKVRLARADQEMERMTQSTSNEVVLLPETLFQKATVLDKLRTVDPAVTKQEVENAYVKALNSYATIASNKGEDFYARLYYAAFLAEAYSTTRISDIIAALVPVYDALNSTNPYRAQYLQNNRNPAAAHHAKLVLLAKTIPQFKDLLISLGWH